MPSDSLHRRRFHELSAAALGGLVAGTLVGCGEHAPPAPGGTAKVEGERHLCRGLNECQGKGASGKNACRGQGECATATHHTCGGDNDCKGLGGCGETAGANECKGKGGCQVPLMESAWQTVHDRQVAAWTKAGVKFGDPPSKNEEPADDSEVE